MKFTSKPLSHGVELVADGDVLPVAAARSDGWSISLSATPLAVEAFPQWLVSALGGRAVKR